MMGALQPAVAAAAAGSNGAASALGGALSRAAGRTARAGAIHSRQPLLTHQLASGQWSADEIRRDQAFTSSRNGRAFRAPSRPPLRAAASAAGAQASAAEQPLEELPERLQKIVKSFQAVPDPRARYQQLLFFASKLPALPKDLQTPEHKVVGCVSQVWVVPRLDPEDGCMYFRADSDSQLTKGLAALLVEGLSGSPPEAILKVTPAFITQLGLKQSLTPSRNNGFLNMLRLMQKHALSVLSESGSETSSTDGTNGAANDASAEASASPSSGGGASAGPAAPATRAESMRQKLTALLQPVKLEIEDVSHQHAGHAGAKEALAAAGKASGSGETHFNVVIVSPAFEGSSTVKRHRMVYQALDEEFRQGLHALSLVTKTPEEASS